MERGVGLVKREGRIEMCEEEGNLFATRLYVEFSSGTVARLVSLSSVLVLLVGITLLIVVR